MLDELTARDFEAAVAPLFEGAPRFIARLAAARPFGADEAMFPVAERIALAMPEDEQLELIDAHPRLGAPPESVSAMSFNEQGYDREASAFLEALEAFEALNAEYEARFGFRYCVFVNGRSRAALVPELRAALLRDPATERDRALRDVVAIARDRFEKRRGT